MNICQVMAGDEEGGLETHLVDLSNGLAALGEEVAVIAHQRYRPRFGGDVRFLPLDLSRGRRNPLLRRRLRQLIDGAAPDIVHAHAGKAAFLVATIDPSARTVGTIHGQKKDLSAYRRFDAVIGVSPGVFSHLEHQRKTVIYNGVPPAPPPLTPAKLGQILSFDAEQTVTLAVGRLVPVKGYDRLIDLWDDSLGQLLIVGDGPERSRLQALAAGKPVAFGGFRNDARALMGVADLMAFSSRREGFSYALAEALRARLPVVSTRVPGAEDLLPPSHLAAPETLKTAIAACLADLEASRERMQKVFDWAANALTVEHMVRATRQVYAEVAP